MVRLIELDRPGAAVGPGMTVEQSTHHFRRFRPGVETIRGSVDTHHTFAALDEIHQTLPQHRVFELQAGSIIEEDHIELPEVLRLEDGHIFALDDFKRAGFFSHDFQSFSGIGNRTVFESLAEGKDQKFPRTRNGWFCRHRVFYFLQFFRRYSCL